MGRPTMRRLVSPLLALLALLAFPLGTVSAQTPSPSPSAAPSAVRLTLLSQTAWNTPSQRELIVRVRAENLTDAPIGELSIGATLYGRVISRSTYEASLVADPAVAIDAYPFPRDGALEPGVPRDFEIAFTLDSPGIDPDDSGVYPFKVDVRSGSVSLAAIRTPVVFLVRTPELPLVVSWTFVLDFPVTFGPDEVFESDALAIALAPGGRLAAQINSLLRLSTDSRLPAVDVAISPVLLTQLGRMRDGYEVATEDGGVREVPEGEAGALLAGQALASLRSIAAAPSVRVSALPFSMPELPSLLSGGLSRDFDDQLGLGTAVVADMLQTTPVPGLLRPPGAVLDDETLQALGERGLTTLVGGPTTIVPPPQPLGFVGPPTAAIGEDGRLVAIVPEPAATALVDATVQADPILAAQVLLGELATIWQEQPGVERGVALVLSEDLLAPSAFYGAFARGVADAPWLDTMHGLEFRAAFPPPSPTSLAPSTTRVFPTTYVGELKRARRRVDTYRSMLVGPSDEPDRLDRMLLLAEARQFLADPSGGLAFITSVHDTVDTIFNAITVSSADVITLTSSTGSGIPVTVSNGADVAVRVTVRLAESPYLRGSPSVDLELGAGDSQTITFRVDAQRTGRFSVSLQVVAPDGRIIEKKDLVVRSTVYNRIALLITVAAAVVLLGLWARRFLPRRTS
jgi:hypothetical protein